MGGGGGLGWPEKIPRGRRGQQEGLEVGWKREPKPVHPEIEKQPFEKKREASMRLHRGTLMSR